VARRGRYRLGSLQGRGAVDQSGRVRRWVGCRFMSVKHGNRSVVVVEMVSTRTGWTFNRRVWYIQAFPHHRDTIHAAHDFSSLR
jgi:hypothetical protein